ncbi:hypothetical protein Y032_0660g1268, partial [Ancylostoma ceylanicum]
MRLLLLLAAVGTIAYGKKEKQSSAKSKENPLAH